jgi:hypothetical protein
MGDLVGMDIGQGL